MRLFGFFGSRSRINDDMAIAPKAGDGKLYRWVQLAAISVMVTALVLLIFEATTLLKMGKTANGVVCSIGVLGLAGFVALPWVRVFESLKQKPYRITSIVFLALIGVCAILWIVSVWMIVGLVFRAIAEGFDNPTTMNSVINSLRVIKVALIISIQFIVASYIAKNIIKYGKTLLPYQVMSGVAQLYLDFYLILVITAVSVNAKDGLIFNQSALLLKNMWFHALLVVAIVIGIFPNTVFARVDRRKMIRARGTVYDTPTDEDMAVTKDANAPVTPVMPTIDPFAPDVPAAPSALDTVDDKLEKIKELLDRGLITQEEYDKKREEILKSI